MAARRFPPGNVCGVRKIAYIIGGAALIAIIGLGMTIGREFLPELDEHLVAASAVADRPVARASEMRGSRDVAARIRNAITQLGRSDDGTDRALFPY